MINKNSSVFVRFPEGKSKALTFSYDDGMLNDVRLIDILDRYKLKCTFNISTGKYSSEDYVYRENWIWNYMKKSHVTELFGNSVHEVAVHGYSHVALATLTEDEIKREVLLDRETLEEQFGRVIRGMAYPKGSYDDKVVEVLKECGIAYSRTINDTESFDLPADWLRLPATCHHNNKRLMELAQKFVDMKVDKDAQLFYLWGHTYEFYENDNWNVIEEFCEFMSGRENDMWYATNIEIFEYLDDFNRLIFSFDNSIIKNPTSRKLWFSFEEKLMSIEAGETIKIK